MRNSLRWCMGEENLLAGPRRSKMEVKIDIMQAIADGSGRPTHIMYRSNLSWAVMRSVMKVLEQQGLVISKEIEGRRSYVLTDKGSRVLHTYRSVKNQFESLPVVVQA
ncbi:MAG: winged helix-turn-helix domain-containing protein [Nitrososphaerales archaeon]